jgi:hypothetical protein
MRQRSCRCRAARVGIANEGTFTGPAQNRGTQGRIAAETRHRSVRAGFGGGNVQVVQSPAASSWTWAFEADFSDFSFVMRWSSHEKNASTA